MSTCHCVCARVCMQQNNMQKTTNDLLLLAHPASLYTLSILTSSTSFTLDRSRMRDLARVFKLQCGRLSGASTVEIAKTTMHLSDREGPSLVRLVLADLVLLAELAIMQSPG